MVNECSWWCQNCNEDFCTHCEAPKETNDGVELCEECFEGLDQEVKEEPTEVQKR